MKTVFPPLDLAAVAIFVVAWFGYAYASDRLARTRPSLLNALNRLREQWMKNALARDMRIVDTNLLGTLMQSATFFSSTTVLILGGAVAGLGGIEKSADMVENLPFAVKASAAVMEMKLLTLVCLFMYAFVKFSWSVRQFNFASILLGAMPETKDVTDADRFHAERLARINSLASENFTKGLRAYYFSLPVLLWFINPLVFIVGTLTVVALTYRVEFHSRTLDALLHAGGDS